MVAVVYFLDRSVLVETEIYSEEAVEEFSMVGEEELNWILRRVEAAAAEVAEEGRVTAHLPVSHLPLLLLQLAPMATST